MLKQIKSILTVMLIVLSLNGIGQIYFDSGLVARNIQYDTNLVSHWFQSVKVTYDTIPAIIQVSDTSLQELVSYTTYTVSGKVEFNDYDYSVRWIKGYVVIKKENGWTENIYYLDRNRIPLSKNILIWNAFQTK